MSCSGFAVGYPSLTNVASIAVSFSLSLHDPIHDIARDCVKKNVIEPIRFMPPKFRGVQIVCMRVHQTLLCVRGYGTKTTVYLVLGILSAGGTFALRRYQYQILARSVAPPRYHYTYSLPYSVTYLKRRAVHDLECTFQFITITTP